MRSLLSRSSVLGAFLMLPACASFAQDPTSARTVAYFSAEELDNLVAPVALYPDALLAQILVASTFPEQIEAAAQYVRERGNRDIDNQGWDISVKAVAYYPPLLNMLYNQEDWATALGQAYAAQSADVMDAVQRLREMAREQGNLVSTPEHTVSYDRDRIVIVPANPQVIYVPTYDPAIVFVRPVFGMRFHGGYFSFGLGFPIGSWLVYDVDWWGRRVYYDGWYGGGWRHNARRYIHVSPIYVHPRHRVININVNIFSRRVNYVNLDRRYRYVRRSVRFDRPDRTRYARDDSRRGDRDRWVDRDDRRGPIDGDRDRNDRDRNDRDGNDRIGDRTAEFDDFRPDRGGNGDARDTEPVARSGFGTVERQREVNSPPQRARTESKGNGNGRIQGGDFRSARPETPVFRGPTKSAKGSDNGGARGATSDFRSSTRSTAPVIRSQPRAQPKSEGNNRQGAEIRGSRPSATFQSQPRSIERKSSGGQVSRPSAPRASQGRPSANFSGGGGGGGGGGKVKAGGSGGSGRVKAGGGGGKPNGGGGKGRKQ